MFKIKNCGVLGTADICEETGCDKSSSIVVLYKSGFMATLHCAFNKTYRNRFEFVGDKDRIILNDGFNSKGNLTLYIIRENRIKQSKLSI